MNVNMSAGWTPPKVGWAEISTDGAVAMDRTTGAGGTIRDVNGRCMVGFQRKSGHASVSATELWALRYGY